jgi:hypothetical protein
LALKEGYIKAKDNVSRLQREKANTRKRELRAKSSLKDVLMELREKNLMTEELSQRVGLYARKMTYGSDSLDTCLQYVPET